MTTPHEADRRPTTDDLPLAVGRRLSSGAAQTSSDVWRPLWRTIRRQALYLGIALGTIVLTALLLASLAVGLQAQRDEARSAELLLIVAPALPSQALIDHSAELGRRGYAPRTILVGAGQAALHAALIERGMAEKALSVGPVGETDLAQLRAALAAARADGASSAVVVASQADLLLWLKLSADAGLRPYGSPVPGPAPNLWTLLQAGARYWRYALLQR